MKPRLCLVVAYSRPGFPKPTTIFTIDAPLDERRMIGGAILRPRFCHGFRRRPDSTDTPSQRRRKHMFGIGYQEMFVILVVALVVFGPARLPELAGQVGRWVRDFRRMSSDLTGEFEKTFAEVEEVKKSFQREIQSIQDEVEGVGKSTRGDLKKLSGKSPSASKKSTATPTKSTSSTASAATSSRAEKRAAKANAASTASGNGAAKVLVLPASRED